jgi:uncharacterized protein YndB with AHSA1/START domain
VIMVDILHRIGIEGASQDAVFAQLTTIDGLAGWWAENTSGSTDTDGVIEFRFGQGGIDMKVVEQVAPERLVWEVVGGPAEWLGTTVTFELKPGDGYTIVLFRHEGWAEPVEFMYHCSTKWAMFLMSLKSLLETGVGAPDPRDQPLGDWR